MSGDGRCKAKDDDDDDQYLLSRRLKKYNLKIKVTVVQMRNASIATIDILQIKNRRAGYNATIVKNEDLRLVQKLTAMILYLFANIAYTIKLRNMFGTSIPINIGFFSLKGERQLDN